MGLCAGEDVSFRVSDLTCKYVAALEASRHMQKWVQQHTEQLQFGVCRKEKQQGKGDRYNVWHTAHAQ